MKIALLTNARSPNPGNWALTTGTINLLEKYFGENTEFHVIPWDDITFRDSIFDDSFFSQVNGCDLFWVVGAVTFNGRAEHTRGGCRLNLSNEDLDRIKVPIVLGGVSYRHWPNQQYHNSEKLYRLLEYLTARKDCLLGMRNDDTVLWLKETIGFQSNKLVKFPDPGFFALSENTEYEKTNSGIIVSMNNEDDSSRFQDQFVMEDFAKTIAFLSTVFWEKYNEIVTFAPHSFEDYQLFEKVFREVPKRRLHQDTNVMPILSGERNLHFYREYAKSRLVIASRVHSMSPALGMGIPTIVLSSQSRISHYIMELGFEDYLFDLREVDSRRGELEKLMTETLSDPSAVMGKLRKIKHHQEREVLEFLDNVTKVI